MPTSSRSPAYRRLLCRRGGGAEVGGGGVDQALLSDLRFGGRMFSVVKQTSRPTAVGWVGWPAAAIGWLRTAVIRPRPMPSDHCVLSVCVCMGVCMSDGPSKRQGLCAGVPVVTVLRKPGLPVAALVRSRACVRLVVSAISPSMLLNEPWLVPWGVIGVWWPMACCASAAVGRLCACAYTLCWKIGNKRKNQNVSF